jgi:hypothetical protein
VEITSISTAPKTNDPFGEISNAKLVLTGTLFEVLDAEQRREHLHLKGEFHLDYEAIDFFQARIFFLPLAEIAMRPELAHSKRFMGIYVQATKESGCIDELAYARIGDCYSMKGGGDGFMLDAMSWERLLEVRLGDGSGERIVIV